MSFKNPITSEDTANITQWPHAPVHILFQRGTYFVTGSTLYRENHFRGAIRLGVLHRGLLSVASEFGWRLDAWAVFSNHYHFVGHSPEDDCNAESLVSMLNKLHSKTAAWINNLDQTPGRKVWFNYRETLLTYKKSFMSRLHYVHANAVKHGLVRNAATYPWCSANWFEQNTLPATVKKIYSFKIDQVNVEDDFNLDTDW